MLEVLARSLTPTSEFSFLHTEIEVERNIEENFSNLTFPYSIDYEDYSRSLLNDTIED